MTEGHNQKRAGFTVNLNPERLSDREVLQTAFECGYLSQGPFAIGDVVTVPGWLAEVLVKRGIVEVVDEV